MPFRPSSILTLFLLLITPTFSRAAEPAGKQESTEGITHGFIAFGAETYRVDSEGKVLWTYPANTRDGWLLPSGNVLLAVSKGKEFPGGGAVEMKPDGTIVWSYKGTQSEVNTVQAGGDRRYMLTEAGAKPRLIEVDSEGKVLVNVPLQAQTNDFHLQTRMSRKLANGDYLVPQLLDKVVREYTPQGKIVWQAKTPETPAEAWPFTAIRLPDGNTLATCTHSKMVVEFDKDAKIVWRLTNDDLPKPMLADPCGAQRLPNGNTVITSYGQNTPGEVKLLEVTREKKVVWTYRDDKKHGIHEFQITETNGKALEGVPLR
ncbi:MAG TPA: hypothetical protein VLJ39_04855 [Tepidisphaeraceae bacterium]|nr:hypothetical protein [Tepidisphaeraceae bacterium]